MPLATTTYYYLTCNGKTDNLLFPKCPAVGPGRLGSEEEAQQAAFDRGWIADGKQIYCPGCKTTVTVHTPDEPAEPKRSRRRGKAESDPVPINGSEHQPEPEHQEQFA